MRAAFRQRLYWALYVPFLAFTLYFILDFRWTKLAIAALRRSEIPTWNWNLIQHLNPGERLQHLQVLVSDSELRLTVMIYAQVIIIGIFIVRNFQSWKDFFKRRNHKTFLELDASEQGEFTTHVFCDKCLAYHDTTFKREEVIKTFNMLILRCDECQTELKIRRD
jgi:hypothetical protein